MLRYLARKVVVYLLTFFVAVTIDWAIPRFMPGDPVEGLLSRMHAQPSAEEALSGYYTEAFGFDVPIWKQYLNFWAALLHGDLGRSIQNFPTSVSELILGALPYTLALLVPAILLSFWAGNKVGAMAARRKALDNSVLPVGYVLTATPQMWLGVVLGVAGALAATRLAASMLYGVGPHDPLTFVSVVALLVLVALGASWLPARRATRVDPMVALRAD